MIIVANRLPVSVTLDKGKTTCTESPGGLASSLHSLLDDSSQFVGWPGNVIEKRDERQIQDHLEERHASTPVFLTKEQVNNYYLGFSNKTIWPLFHDFPNKIIQKDEFYTSYKQVNQSFAKKIAEIIRPNEEVFIQDYQLLLLPKFVREFVPNARIGFFLHTPFPTYEMLQHLEKAHLQELLEGVLGADVVGFHTEEYMNNFVECIQKVLKVEIYANTTTFNGRSIAIENIPLGIDYKKYLRARQSETVQTKVTAAKKWFGDKKVFFSVDRLDYTKGILNRLLGYGLFLQQNPAFHRKVVFVVNVQPSRTEIEDYQMLRHEVETLVERINATFGDYQWKPIIYHFSSLSFEQMVIYYNLADVAVITPLRDGMNLIAKEFIASKEKEGVLILSGNAGAAQELTEALIVNPHNVTEIAHAFKKALVMEKYEQEERLLCMQTTLQVFTSKWWSTYWMRLLRSRGERRETYPHLSFGENLEIAKRSNLQAGYAQSFP